MVFEQIIKPAWIARKEHAFFLGFFYTLLAIISSKIIFPSSFGLMSVAFTAILLVPSLNILLATEENEEVREKKFSLRLLWKDHNDILRVYIFMFLGIFFAFALATVFLGSNTIIKGFSPQLNAAGFRGGATDYLNSFFSIVKNNLIIFIVCFILSLVYGAGAVIFLAWNASVWGVVFGFVAKNSAIGGGNVLGKFAEIILPVMPHLTTEALAYVWAAIVGGIVSKAIIREKVGSKKFNHIITDGLILMALGLIVVVAAGLLEVYFYGRFFAMR